MPLKNVLKCGKVILTDNWIFYSPTKSSEQFDHHSAQPFCDTRNSLLALDGQRYYTSPGNHQYFQFSATCPPSKLSFIIPWSGIPLSWCHCTWDS